MLYRKFLNLLYDDVDALEFTVVRFDNLLWSSSFGDCRPSPGGGVYSLPLTMLPGPIDC